MSVSDSSVIERVYRAYSDTLYRIALSYLQNPGDAQDAVHDAFVTYMEKAPCFFGEQSEKAWFCRVTVNKCRDALRRRAVRRHDSLDDPSALSVPARERGLPPELADLLSHLPDKLRLALILHELEGFSVAEVARLTASTPSAVKMRLSRAREALRNMLGGEET